MIERIPFVVAQIGLSKIISADGRIKITVNILIIAPRAIRLQRAEIISMSEYSPTPNVAAKNPSADTITELMEVESAI